MQHLLARGGCVESPPRQTSQPRKGGGLLAFPRFDFCLTPREQVVRSAAPLGFCGAPMCTTTLQETDLNVVRVPRCDIPRCGQCAVVADTDLADAAELSLVPESMGMASSILQKNLQLARSVVREVFQQLENRCLEEKQQYAETGSAPPRYKLNTWATYTNKAQLHKFTIESLEFARHNSECKTRLLTAAQLRFLILLQHFVSEDTMDFYRPEGQRKHQDNFEGILTDGVNSQLVKDAHRSEFSVDGVSFNLELPADLDGDLHDEQRGIIEKFQRDFVMALESHLLAYASRRGLSALAARKMLQVVTTQMSQAGLANLDRGSQATRFFVGSCGLEQRTAYNLSTMSTPDRGECLKLSILCMKTGFTQYLEKDEILRMPGVDYPKKCKPASYLYQYATLCFSPGPYVDNCESMSCTLLDALDEAHIDPADS